MSRSADTAPSRADTRPRAEIELEVFHAGIAAGLGELRDLPLDSHLHTVRSPDANAQLDGHAALAVERGIAELAITDHVDFDPSMPAYGFASFADRERDVREAAARWADRGLAIRFGVEVTYERHYEDEIRGWLRRHPHDYVIGSVHISSHSPYKAGNVATFVSGRSLPEVVEPYFDDVIGAARSGLFDTIGHLDFVKRYLVPHVMPADLARAPELYEPVLQALVESGAALEVNASGLRQLPRETYPSPAIVARYRALGGRHVTVGSDAHRTEWFAYGLREAYRHAAGAGFEALTFRRGGRRVSIPVPPIDTGSSGDQGRARGWRPDRHRSTTGGMTMKRNRVGRRMLAAAGAIALIVGACGGSSTASPSGAATNAPSSTAAATEASSSPAATTEASSTAAAASISPIGALADLTSYKILIAMASKNTTGGLAAMGDLTMDGTVVLKPDPAADVKLTLGPKGAAMTMRVVEVGGKSYVDLGSGLVESTTSQTSMVESLSPGKMFGSLDQYASGMQVVGDEQKNGVDAVHLKASPDVIASASASLSSLGLTNAAWTWDMWVAKTGGYAVSYVMKGTGDGDASMSISMDLTDVNSPSNVVKGP